MITRGNPGLAAPGKGYTILEVLIFVAVSAFVFVAAMAAIGGRQEQVQFSQSVREFESKISDIMNDVTTGYYPTNGYISCVLDGSGDVTIIEDETGTQSVGTSEQCLYIGKAIQFEPAITGQADSSILVYNLVGRRFSDDGTTTVKNITQAQPKAVAFESTASQTDSVESIILGYGIEVTRVFEDTNSAAEEEFGAIGFISGFEGSSLDIPVSGNQSLSIGGIQSSITRLNAQKGAMRNLLNSINEDSSSAEGYMNTVHNGIVVCLKNDQGRIASLTIGADRNNSVSLGIEDSSHPGCEVDI